MFMDKILSALTEVWSRVSIETNRNAFLIKEMAKNSNNFFLVIC
jgi:hypothetical protein